jgi:hypothetical protein
LENNGEVDLKPCCGNTLLVALSEGQAPCKHVQTLLDNKLSAIDEQLRVLTEFRRDLLELRQAAVTTKQAAACVCGFIERHVTLD